MEKNGEEKGDIHPVPKWLQVKFGQLWNKFGHAEFTIDQATETLEISKEVVAVILSRLRKNGWLTVRFAEKDYRKRLYQLHNPSDFFRKIVAEMGENNAQNNKS